MYAIELTFVGQGAGVSRVVVRTKNARGDETCPGGYVLPTPGMTLISARNVPVRESKRANVAQPR